MAARAAAAATARGLIRQTSNQDRVLQLLFPDDWDPTEACLHDLFCARVTTAPAPAPAPAAPSSPPPAAAPAAEGTASVTGPDLPGGSRHQGRILVTDRGLYFLPLRAGAGGAALRLRVAFEDISGIETQPGRFVPYVTVGTHAKQTFSFSNFARAASAFRLLVQMWQGAGIAEASRSIDRQTSSPVKGNLVSSPISARRATHRANDPPQLSRSFSDSDIAGMALAALAPSPSGRAGLESAVRAGGSLLLRAAGGLTSSWGASSSGDSLAATPTEEDLGSEDGSEEDSDDSDFFFGLQAEEEEEEEEEEDQFVQAAAPPRHGEELEFGVDLDLGDPFPHWMGTGMEHSDDGVDSAGDSRAMRFEEAHRRMMEMAEARGPTHRRAPRRSNNELNLKAKCFSSTAISRPEIDSGDKIILHQDVLTAALKLESHFPWPLSFEVTNPSNDVVVHCGVLDFTAAKPSVAYLPAWMMGLLACQDGESMCIKAVNLPKGTFCQLQPLTVSWLDIPYEQRQTVLEFQLRNYQNLTEGGVIHVHHEHASFPFKVLQCKPAKGISIVDTDIETDIVEPAEEAGAINPTVVAPWRSYGGEAADGCLVYYTLRPRPQTNRLPRVCVSLSATAGDPDLYISQACTKPTRRQYLACNQDEGSKTWLLPLRELDPTAPVHVGVGALVGAVAFTIQFDEVVSRAGDAEGEDDSPTAPPSPSPNGPEPGPDEERCPNCQKCIPKARMFMHERHCKRCTYHCKACNLNMSLSSRVKHDLIAHTPLACKCGVELVQAELHVHQSTDCKFRLVTCPQTWCRLRFPQHRLEQHIAQCVMREVSCPMCRQELRYRDLEGHLAMVHSVDTSIIDWSTDLNPESFQFIDRHADEESPLKCKCSYFAASIEDLQMHMLTVCPLREQTIEGIPSNEPGPERARSSNPPPTDSGFGSSVALVPWACAACTFLNEPARATCEMCRADRPPPPLPSPPPFAVAPSAPAPAEPERFVSRRAPRPGRGRRRRLPHATRRATNGNRAVATAPATAPATVAPPQLFGPALAGFGPAAFSAAAPAPANPFGGLAMPPVFSAPAAQAGFPFPATAFGAGFAFGRAATAPLVFGANGGPGSTADDSGMLAAALHSTLTLDEGSEGEPPGSRWEPDT